MIFYSFFVQEYFADNYQYLQLASYITVISYLANSGYQPIIRLHMYFLEV